MLESYLSKLLADRFGRYLKLDNEKLRVAAWKGNVELHDIEIHADALSDTLDGPVRVVCGNIGNFNLHVPWTALGSRPVEIVIEDVIVLLAPLDTWGMDPRDRRRRARYAKMIKVESKMLRYRQKEEEMAAATAAAAASASASTATAGAGKPGAGFWRRLIAKVFHNIQVTVRRVHIRYEDSMTCPGRFMSLGLTLNEVLSQTTDADWNVSFNEEVGSGRMHKLVNIEDLGLYCDTLRNGNGLSQIGGGGGETGGTWKAFVDDNIRAQLSIQEHDYVLYPLSGSARLSLGQSDVSLDICVPSMGMSLSTHQLMNIHAMHLTLKDLDRWVVIFRHRPLSPPTKDPCGWWKYAVWCITPSLQRRDVRCRLGWLDVIQLLRKRKEYVKFYQARLESRLMPSDYQAFMHLEDELSVNEIVAFQKIAESDLARHYSNRSNITGAVDCDVSSSSHHHLPPPKEDGETTGWLGTLFGYAKRKQLQEDDRIVGKAIDELSESERYAIRKEMIEAFSMDEEEDIGTTECWKAVVILNLNNATLTLIEGKSPCLRIVLDTKLYFSGLVKRHGSWKIEATLGGLHIFDPSAGPDVISTIVQRKRRYFYSDKSSSSSIVEEEEATVQIGDFSVVETGSVIISYTPGGQAEGGGGSSAAVVEYSTVDVNLRIAAHEVTYVPRCFSRTVAVFQSAELRAVIAEARYRIGGVQSNAYFAASSFLRGLALSSRGGGGGVAKVSKGSTFEGKNVRQQHKCEEQGTTTAAANDFPESLPAFNNVIRPSRMVFTASIHAEAPLVILLESPDDLRVEKGQLLLIDLGCVTLSPNSPDDTTTNGKEDLGWALSLAGIQAVVLPDAQVFLYNSGPSLSSAIHSSRPLIESFDVTLKLLPTVDPSSGKLKHLLIGGDLPRLSIRLHSSSFRTLRRMLHMMKLEDFEKEKEDKGGGRARGGGGVDWNNANDATSEQQQLLLLLSSCCTATTTTSPFPEEPAKHWSKRNEGLLGAVTEVEWMDDEQAEREEREEQLRALAEKRVAVEIENWGGVVIDVVFSFPLTLLHINGIEEMETDTLQQQQQRRTRARLSSSIHPCTEDVKKDESKERGGCLACIQLQQLTVQCSFDSSSSAEAESSTVSVSLDGLLVDDEYQGAGVAFKPLLRCPSASQFCSSSLVQEQPPPQNNIPLFCGGDDEGGLEDTATAPVSGREKKVAVGGALTFSKVGNAAPLLKMGFLQANWNPETISNIVQFVGIIGRGEKLSSSSVNTRGEDTYQSDDDNDEASASAAYALLPVSRIEAAGAIINLNKEKERRHFATIELGPLSVESFPGSKIKAEAKGFCMSVNYGEDICQQHWCELVRGSKACLTVNGGRSDCCDGSENNRMIHESPPFCLDLVNSCVVYLQQPWLECLDYISCGILGPAIWKPWLLMAEAEAGSSTAVKERVNDAQVVATTPVLLTTTASSSPSPPDSFDTSTRRPVQELDGGGSVLNTVLSVTASDLRLILPCNSVSNDGLESFTPFFSVELKRSPSQLHEGRGTTTLWNMSVKDARATFFHRPSPMETTQQLKSANLPPPSSFQAAPLFFMMKNDISFYPYSTVVTGLRVDLNVESYDGRINFTGTVTGGSALKVNLQVLRSLRAILRENLGAQPIGHCCCLQHDGPPPVSGGILPPRIVYNYAKLSSPRGVYVASIHFVNVRLVLANNVVASSEDAGNNERPDDKRSSKTSDEFIARMSCDDLMWNISWSPDGRCLGIKIECPQLSIPTAEGNNNDQQEKEGLLLCSYTLHNEGGNHHDHPTKSHPFIYFETRWCPQEIVEEEDIALSMRVFYKIELSEICVMAEKERWAKIIQTWSSTSSAQNKDEENIPDIQFMQTRPKSPISTATSFPASASSWVLDLETRKTMFVLVDATTTSPRPLPSSHWSEGDNALIGICNTLRLKAYLPFTNGYLAAAASCHSRDHDIENGDDESGIKLNIEEAEAYRLTIEEVNDTQPSVQRTALMDGCGTVMPVFRISTGRCLLSWQENCDVRVEYEMKQDREKHRRTRCYTVQVSIPTEECSGPKLECSVTDVAVLRLALFNLISSGGSSNTLSSHSNGDVTSFLAVAKPESESEPEPEAVTIINVSCDGIHFDLIDDSGLYFEDTLYTTALHHGTDPVHHLVARVLLRGFSFKRMENGDVFVDCALLSVVDCLQSPGSSMYCLVQCPGPACMTMLNRIDKRSGIRERKLKIELPDNLRVNWNPQTVAALWQLGAAFKLSWGAAEAAAAASEVCVPPPSSHTAQVQGCGIRQYVRSMILDALECEARDIAYSQRLEVESFDSTTGSGRPNPVDWAEHRTWAVEEKSLHNYSCKPSEEAAVARMLSLVVILGKHTGIFFNKEVGDYCVLDLVMTGGGQVSMTRQPNGDMDYNGQFMEVLVSDPRASLGSLYSDIITVPVAKFTLSMGSEIVALSPAATMDGNGNGNQMLLSPQNQNQDRSNNRRPYNFFSLHLLSGPHVVYIQQLWLESLDYISYGILGPALWGNPVAPDGQNHLLEWLRARDGRQPIGLSRLEVFLEDVTCLVPHNAESKTHILSHLSSLRFITWVECEEVIDNEDGRRMLRGDARLPPPQESGKEEEDPSKEIQRQSDTAARVAEGDIGEENDISRTVNNEVTMIQMVHGSSIQTSAVLQVRHTRVEVPSFHLEAADLEDVKQHERIKELSPFNGRHLLGPLKLVVSMSNPSGWDSEVLAEHLSNDLLGSTTPLHALSIHIDLFPLEGTSSSTSWRQPTCAATSSETEREAMRDDEGAQPFSSSLVIQLNKWSLGVLMAVLRNNLSTDGFNGLDIASLWAEGRRKPCRNIDLCSNLKWTNLSNGSTATAGSSSCCSSCNESFTCLINPYYCCGCGGLRCRQCLTSGTVACVHPSGWVREGREDDTSPTAALLCQICAGQAFDSLRSRVRSRVRFWFGSELPRLRPIAVQLSIDTLECFIFDELGQQPGSSDMLVSSANDENDGKNSAGQLKNQGNDDHFDEQRKAIALVTLESLSVEFSRGAQKDHYVNISANGFTVTALRHDSIHSKLVTSQKLRNVVDGNERQMTRNYCKGCCPSSSMCETSSSSEQSSSSSSNRSPPQNSDSNCSRVMASQPAVELVISKSNAGIRKLNLVTNQMQVTLAPREWISILMACKFIFIEGALEVSDLATLHRAHCALDGSFLDYILKMASSCNTSTTTIETAATGDAGAHDEDRGYTYTSCGVHSSSIPPECHIHAVLYDFMVVVLEDSSSKTTNAVALQCLVTTQYLRMAEQLPPVIGEEEGPSNVVPGLLFQENALVSHETNLKVQDLHSLVLVKMDCDNESGRTRWDKGSKQQLDGDGEYCDASEFSILGPISISLDIIGIEYPLQPFVQRITCDLSRITSRFSYGDLKIVEGILTGWFASFSSMMKENNAEGDVTHPCKRRSVRNDTNSCVTPSGTFLYDVVFKKKKLGIVLRREGGMAVLDEANPEVTRDVPQLYKGDEVAAVAGQSVSGFLYQDIVELIKSISTRPLCITFRCSVYSWPDVGVREYVVVHRLGNELEGIKICAGGMGNQAVVMHVPKDWIPQDSVLEPEWQRIHRHNVPRPGSVVMSINGIPTDTLSLNETWKLIQTSRRPARVRYRDVSSSTWPQCLLQLELTSPQINATMMDGHDAASLMLEMLGVMVNGESGPGVHRQLTRHKDPRHPFNIFAKKLGCNDVVDSNIVEGKKESSSVVTSSSQSKFSQSGSVLNGHERQRGSVLMARRLGCNVEVQLLYHNSRVGAWEPFLEPTTFCFEYEDAVPILQEGTGLERGPCYMHDWSKGGLSALHVTCSEDLCMNVTDAALECFIRILKDRETFFAKRIKGPIAHRHAPFILQNSTEFPLEFWVHDKKVSNLPISFDTHHNYHPLHDVRCHRVGPFSDCPFVPEQHVVMGDGKGAAAAESNHFNRLREGSEDMALHVTIRITSAAGGTTSPLASHPLLNLPLQQVGAYALSCFLGQENSVLPLKSLDGTCVRGRSDVVGKTNYAAAVLEEIGLTWEVRLESGRRVLTLRSAVEILNMTGVDLRIKCSSAPIPFRGKEEEKNRGVSSSEQATTAVTAEASKRKEEVIGIIHPGGTLPLPLGWSNTNSIYIQPASLPGIYETYGYGDCSLLMSVPSPDATDPNNSGRRNVAVDTVAWTKCMVVEGSETRAADSFKSLSCAAAAAAAAPLFFFVNALERSSRGWGYNNDHSVMSTGTTTTTTPLVSPRGRGLLRTSNQQLQPSCSFAFPSQPILVEIYACLVLRNALPLPLEYRICTIIAPNKDHHGGLMLCGSKRTTNVIATGTLEPGAVKHVYELNILVDQPDVSYHVEGFDWTTRHRLEKPCGSSISVMTVDDEWEEEYVKREVLACHNHADQLLYFSMEVTSPRPNCLSIIVWTDFWIRNLSGLPVIIGEPVLQLAPDGTLLEKNTKTTTATTGISNRTNALPDFSDGGTAAALRGDSGSQGTLDANLAPVQSSSVMEEVFEIYLTSTGVVTPSWGNGGGIKSYFGRNKKQRDLGSCEGHLWCTDSGQPCHSPQDVRLPDNRWMWVGNWDVDFTGKVSQDGWESCSRLYRCVGGRSQSSRSSGGEGTKNAGRSLSYGSDMFNSQRIYNENEPIHRRRWIRLRMLKGVTLEEHYKTSSLITCDAAAAAEEEGVLPRPSRPDRRSDSVEEELKDTDDTSRNSSSLLLPSSSSNGGILVGVTVYQPTSSLLSTSDTRHEIAAVCLKIGDSAWSETLPIGMQGYCGAIQIPGARWPEVDNAAIPSPLHELSYSVMVPSPPWNRTRIITIASRYTILNRTQNLCFLAQQEGVVQRGKRASPTKEEEFFPTTAHCTSLLLPPGSSKPLHWSDRHVEKRLSLTVAATTCDGRKDRSYLWSGGISVDNIGSFPVLVRSTQDVFSGSSGVTMRGVSRHNKQQLPQKQQRGREEGRDGGGYGIRKHQAAVPYMALGEGCSGTQTCETENEVTSLPCSIVVNVLVAFGDLALKGMENNRSSAAATAAVHVIIEEEGAIGGPAPSFRLENHSPISVYYVQCGISGPGDMLPAKSQCMFGWDNPCPTDPSNLKVCLSTAPFNSQSGKRMSHAIDFRNPGESVDMVVERGGGGCGKEVVLMMLQVKIVQDGPTKVAFIKHIPLPESSLVTAGRALQFLTNQKKWSAELNAAAAETRTTINRLGHRLPQATAKKKMTAPLARVGPQPSMISPLIRPTSNQSSRSLRISSSLGPYSDCSSSSTSSVSPVAGGDIVTNVGDLNLHEEHYQRYALEGRREKCSGEVVNDSATGEHLWLFRVFLKSVRLSVVDTAAPESSNLRVSSRKFLENLKGIRRDVTSLTCCYDSGEMLLASMEKVSVSVFGRRDSVTLRAGVRGAIRIDNHMPRSPYPILLQTVSKMLPSSPSHEQQPGRKPAADGDEEPSLEIRATILMNVPNLLYFEQFYLKMNTIDLNLDEDVVTWAQSFIDRAVACLSTELQPGELEDWILPHEAWIPTSVTTMMTTSLFDGGAAATTEKNELDVTPKNKKSPRDAVMYFALLHVAPIKVRLSLQRPMRKAEDIYSGIKPVQLLLDIMMKVNSSHISLDKFTMTHETIGRSQLFALCRAHYLRQLKQKALRVLGSLEALGNPVGLLRGMGQGMQDFMAEPVIGLVQSVEDMRPDKFFAGVARGGGSLLNNTAGGVANSASMITGTFSDILVSTMDSRYQRARVKRAEQRGGSRPRDMLQGISSGGVSLVQGFSDGVAGVFVNPYKGAEKDGFAGFARGVGTGVIGLVVKPVVGIGDAATNVLQGVKGTTENIAQSSSGQVESSYAAASSYQSSLELARYGQLRPRRALYGHHRILKRYCLKDAQVASLLASLPKLGRGSSPSLTEGELCIHNEMERAAQSDGTTRMITGRNSNATKSFRQQQQYGHNRSSNRGWIPEQYIAHVDIPGSGLVILTKSKIIMLDTCSEVSFYEELGNIVGVQVDQVNQGRIHRVIIHLRRVTTEASTPAEVSAMKEGITLPPSPEDLEVMGETATAGVGGSSRRVFNRVIECPTSEKSQQLAMLLENGITDRPLWLL